VLDKRPQEQEKSFTQSRQDAKKLGSYRRHRFTSRHEWRFAPRMITSARSATHQRRRAIAATLAQAPWRLGFA
jgi:hypothetical protein